MIVVDVNILAYLLIGGDRTQVCREVFRKDPVWNAPYIWRSEFRNVLAKYIRHANMPLEGAKLRMKEATGLLGGREYFLPSGSILEIVNGQPVSAYNAEYAFLASKLGTRLVTTDKPLLEMFPSIAIPPERFL